MGKSAKTSIIKTLNMIRTLPKTVDSLLLITIIVGVVLVIRETLRNRELRATNEPLAREFGRFPIDDPEKIYVLALKSDGPLHFPPSHPPAPHQRLDPSAIRGQHRRRSGG